MYLNRKAISLLNEIISYERRMELVYSLAAQTVTGPYREALSEEFKDHANDEKEHADIAMRHVVALGGVVQVDIAEMPVWRTLDEILSGLEKLEKEGIERWQELLKLCQDHNDAFAHVIEGVLETEIDHYDEIRIYNTKNGNVEKSFMSDLGSRKPLNFKLTNITVYQEPEKNWDTKIDEHYSKGIVGSSSPPVIIGGNKDGRRTSLSKAVPNAINPDLVLDVNKAVLTPVKTDPDGKRQFARKRDDNGKFAPNQNLKIQTTAQDDAASQERDAKLARTRMKDKLEGNDPDKGKVTFAHKGFGDGNPSGIQNVSGMNPTQGANQGNVIGQTDQGLPIYDDPYNPAHAGFTQQDYQKAAQIMMQQGDSQKANVFQQLSQDSGSPMERMGQQAPAAAGQSSMQQAVQTMKSLNPFNWFFQQQHAQAPGAGGMPGMPNQNTVPGAAPGGMPPGGPPQAGGMQGAPPNPNQNQPQLPGLPGSDTGMRNGPVPGMINTQTGTGLGPQTNVPQFSGTSPISAEMPQDPYNGTDITGQNQQMAPVPGLPAPSPQGAPPDQFGVMQNYTPQSVGAQPQPLMPGATGIPPGPAGPGTAPPGMGAPQTQPNPTMDPNAGQGEDVTNMFDFTGTPPSEGPGMGDDEEEGGGDDAEFDLTGDSDSEGVESDSDSSGGFGESDSDDNGAPEEKESKEESDSEESSEDKAPAKDKKDVFKSLLSFVNKKYK